MNGAQIVDSNKKILVLHADRAERSILDPIVNELSSRKVSHMYVDLSKQINQIHKDKNLSKIYDYCFELTEQHNFNFVIVIGDRREITFACLAFFTQQIPVYQMASGDLSSEMSLVDDYYRHLITIMSSKQISFSKKSLKTTNDLLSKLNISADSTYYANPTLNDISINDEALFPQPYDLILLHPQSLSYDGTCADLQTVLSLINPSKTTIIIKGNKDKNYEVYYDAWQQLSQQPNFKIYENVEKQKFINLLRNADRFISNSSCTYYEAPIFLSEDKIIRIGRRNKNREIVDYKIQEIKSASNIVDFMLGT